MSAPSHVLSSRRLRFWLPIVSGLVLVAGVIAAVVAFDLFGLRNTAAPVETPLSNKPAQVFKLPKRVALERGIRQVAGKFILSAVNRSDLGASWKLVSPNLKYGYTYKEWLTGNIPVVPYPAVSLASFKVDHSYRDDALLEVLLFPAKSSKVKPQIFFIGLKKFGQGAHRRWLVDYWAPRGRIAVPSTLNN